MSYLCDGCPARYGLRRVPWKTVWGPVTKKEEKRQGFVTYCEVFIVGLHDIAMHVWNIRIVYVLMDNNVEIKGN
jgi:hypothetical protein